jgi:predicted metalloprotease with PDZ domain
VPDTDFLVTLIPLTGSATGAISYGGTGTTGGFALEATDNVPHGDFIRTLAHEYGHRWFGKGFGHVDEGAGPYWFTEGVNDWFAASAMVRSGLWATTDWARQLDTVLLRYGTSTARDLDDAALTAQFWTNPDAMQVQYDRGFLAALLLDRRVPLLPILTGMARQPATVSQEQHFAALVDAVQPGAVAKARTATARPLPADALAACGTLRTVSRPAYDRGFDTDDARTVTAVRTRAAQAAGIRVGMRYLRRIAFEYLDSTVPYVAEFALDGVARTIRWLPAADVTATFQQLDPTAIDTPQCHTLIAPAAPTP